MPITHHEVEVTPNPLPVVGPITDTELRATPVPVSGTVTANAGTGPFPVSDNGGSLTVDGTVSVDNFPGASSSTATVTRVTVNPSTATNILVSNSLRKRAIIHNEAGTLYLKFGVSASTTDYTYRLVANTTIEVDQYSGDITAIKASGTTDVQVTEY